MNPKWLTHRLKAALAHAEMRPFHLDKALQEEGIGQTAGYTSRVLRGERKKIEFERVAAWTEVLKRRCVALGKPAVRFAWLASGEGEMLEGAVDPLEAAVTYLGDRLSPRAVTEVRVWSAEHPEVTRTAFGWGQVLVETQRRITEEQETDVGAVVTELECAS